MRTLILFSLALAALAAGCGSGSEGTEQASLGVPERDLTLQQGPAAKVEVASPAELGRAQPARPASDRPRRARRPITTPRAASVAATEPGALAPSPAPSREVAPVAVAASEPEDADPHALPPGRSVTIIPASSGTASSGPATDDGWTDQRPAGPEGGVSVGGGHGKGCRPRGVGSMPGSQRPGALR